jgi:shikimate 5-dehydrogenase
MKRWTSLSPNNEDKRWELLSRYLRELGVENEFEPFKANDDVLENLGPLDHLHYVRISSRFGPQVLKLIPVQSSWITTLGVIDGILKRDGKWWPMCALFESFGSVIFELGQDLDMRGSILVAGAGGTARIAIAALFKAGFRNFLLTNFNESEGQKTIDEVRSKFFGLTLQYVPQEKIVLLPGESSVLVNCTPSVEENALLVELSYMNFLKRPGFLFDVSRKRTPSILVQEAKDAGVKVINGTELAARTDQLWAKWAFGVDIPLDKYLQDFESILD